MRVTLTFLDIGPVAIDVRSLQPAEIFTIPRSEIEKIPITVGNRLILLGDVSKVECSTRDADELLFTGVTAFVNHAGHGMKTGKLIIADEGGSFIGAGMCAGEIEVLGSAGDCLGLGMQGGLVRVQGNAGNWCGACQPGQGSGMSGGIILVGKNAGQETGAGMQRGLIFISGDTGEYAGARMQAGSLFVIGKAGVGTGLGMRRGSIVAGKIENLLPGFTSTGFADNEWLRIYSKMLEKKGIYLPSAWMEREMHRYNGDTLELGKGELIVYDFTE
jgi:formylmethanofuran dehydrogenase subunit C